MPISNVNELALVQIWNAQWLTDELRTSDGQPLRVVYRGVWTHGVGPDFSGALLDLAGRLISGDIEVHRHASGWREHGHHLDPAYNTVVLHVVLDDDLPGAARRQDGTVIPVLRLRDHLLGPLEAFQPTPALRPLGAIGFEHCAPRAAATKPDAIRHVWETAGDARLAAKVTRVAQSFGSQPPGQTLYELLLDALGYSRNREGMRAIAARLPWDHLEARLHRQPPSERWFRAAGLLLGVGGFLPLSPREAELAGLDPAKISRIEQEWRRHGAAWHDLTLPPTSWSLTRQRPAGHPIRRLLALATLLARLDAGLIEDLCALARRPAPYRSLIRWLTTDNPYLGAAQAHEIVINVAIPFTLAYAEESGQDDLATAAGQLWDAAPAGSGNALTRRTIEQICGPSRIPVRSARAEQGLLHLHQTGCALMRCYECPIALLALADAGTAVNAHEADPAKEGEGAPRPSPFPGR